MKPALRRSLSLWSGLIVMAFLGWAWAQSHHRGAFISGGKGSVASIAGGVFVHWNPAKTSSPIALGHVGPLLMQLEGEPKMPRPFAIRGGLIYAEAGLVSVTDSFPTLERLFQARAPNYPPGYRLWFAPYWCLLLTAGMLWTILLAWRILQRNRTVTLG